MNSSRLPHVLWALFGICLFLAGYFLGGEPGGITGGSRGARMGAAGPEASEGERVEGTAGQALANAGESAPGAPLSPAEVRTRTFQVLGEANRVARLGHLCQLLEQVNSDNWQEMLDGFMRQKSAEGRTFGPEWELALERVGEVAGHEAVANLLAAKEANRRGWANWVLAGWAAKDPTAAVAWMQEQPDKLRGPLLEHFFKGLGRSAPKQAVEFAATLPVDTAREQLPRAVYSAIQSEGFRGAEEMLTSIQHRPDIDEGVKNMLFVTLAKNKIQSGSVDDDPVKALTWVDPYLGQTYMGPHITDELVGVAAKANPAGTMEWLNAKYDRLTEVQATSSVLAITREWQKADPAAFEQWMATHPTHPQYGVVATEVMSRALEAGQQERAQQWLATIREPHERVVAEVRFEAMLRRPKDPNQNTVHFEGGVIYRSPVVPVEAGK